MGAQGWLSGGAPGGSGGGRGSDPHGCCQRRRGEKTQRQTAQGLQEEKAYQGKVSWGAFGCDNFSGVSLLDDLTMSRRFLITIWRFWWK